MKPAKIHLKVPPGVDEGTQLKVTGEGEAGRQGGPRGNLYVRIHVKPHDEFRREGDDVIYQKSIMATNWIGTTKKVDFPSSIILHEICHGIIIIDSNTKEYILTKGQRIKYQKGYRKGENGGDFHNI